jgi:hypothetical protein
VPSSVFKRFRLATDSVGGEIDDSSCALCAWAVKARLLRSSDQYRYTLDRSGWEENSEGSNPTSEAGGPVMGDPRETGIWVGPWDGRFCSRASGEYLWVPTVSRGGGPYGCRRS